MTTFKLNDRVTIKHGLPKSQGGGMSGRVIGTGKSLKVRAGGKTYEVLESWLIKSDAIANLLDDDSDTAWGRAKIAANEQLPE